MRAGRRTGAQREKGRGETGRVDYFAGQTFWLFGMMTVLTMA